MVAVVVVAVLQYIIIIIIHIGTHLPLYRRPECTVGGLYMLMQQAVVVVALEGASRYNSCEYIRVQCQFGRGGGINRCIRRDSMWRDSGRKWKKKQM